MFIVDDQNHPDREKICFMLQDCVCAPFYLLGIDKCLCMSERLKARNYLEHAKLIALSAVDIPGRKFFTCKSSLDKDCKKYWS